MWHDVALEQPYLTLSEVLGALDLLDREHKLAVHDDGDTLVYSRPKRP
jgi:hypothetical protein